MTGPELLACVHPLGVALLAEGGDMVAQVLAVDDEGQVVGRTMLLGSAGAADVARSAAEAPEVWGLVYLGLADRGGDRALFLEAVGRGEPEVHFQVFQAFRLEGGEVHLAQADGFRVPAVESHLGPVFQGK